MSGEKPISTYRIKDAFPRAEIELLGDIEKVTSPDQLRPDIIFDLSVPTNPSRGENYPQFGDYRYRTDEQGRVIIEGFRWIKFGSDTPAFMSATDIHLQGLEYLFFGEITAKSYSFDDGTFTLEAEEEYIDSLIKKLVDLPNKVVFCKSAYEEWDVDRHPSLPKADLSFHWETDMDPVLREFHRLDRLRYYGSK